jgi:arabinosaccharide transport system permease protein
VNVLKLAYQKYQRKAAPYFFIAPFFIAYAIFGAYPALHGLWLSFFETQGLKTTSFVGFGNYAELLKDPRFVRALGNTTYYAAGSIFVILPVALAIALAINSKLVGNKGFFTTAYFLPQVTSSIVVGIMFTMIFDYDYGMLNYYLSRIGIQGYRWLRIPQFAIPSLILLGLWRYTGVNSLYFLSGLQGIPDDIYEAATIDGANWWDEFIYITLPLLRPIGLFIVVQAIIGSYNLFAEPYILGGQSSGGAGPGDSMLMMTAYLYINAFQFVKFGYASAIGYSITIIILFITLIQLKVFRAFED